MCYGILGRKAASISELVSSDSLQKPGRENQRAAQHLYSLISLTSPTLPTKGSLGTPCGACEQMCLEHRSGSLANLYLQEKMLCTVAPGHRRSLRVLPGEKPPVLRSPGSFQRDLQGPGAQAGSTPPHISFKGANDTTRYKPPF